MRREIGGRWRSRPASPASVGLEAGPRARAARTVRLGRAGCWAMGLLGLPVLAVLAVLAAEPGVVGAAEGGGNASEGKVEGSSAPFVCISRRLRVHPLPPAGLCGF